MACFANNNVNAAQYSHGTLDVSAKTITWAGFINETWTRVDKPGIYRGQCTELCGKDHGFMPVVVEAVPEEEYNTWVAEKKERCTESGLLWINNVCGFVNNKVYVLIEILKT